MRTLNAAGYRRQRGFTLVELMIAILVGLFLTGGLVMMMQSNRRAFTSQNQLSQLQDNERLAMNMITDIVQIAGYFPDPTTYTAASTMAAITTPTTMGAGQYMYGAHTAAAPGDTLYVRFASKSGDGILNCGGTSNTSGVAQSYLNEFYISTTAPNANTLMCSLTTVGTATTTTVYPLISNVVNMQILYGIDTTGSAYNVNEYLNGTQVNAAGAWNKVISVQITLTLSNPLYDATKTNNQGQPQTVSISRTAAVMNTIGL